VTPDAFETAALRRAVLDAWRGSPTRLREDANLEEDHAHGYYRDRVVVELAQNAADAAVRAGVPGRVTFRLDATAPRPILRVVNTGAPLDAAGVASLASLRASSKGAGEVGRFGVGFAAVRSVSDDITLRSTSGGVRFSTALTRAEAQAAGVVHDGSTRLAALRLPFPADPLVPSASAPGVATVVELVLRNDDAVAAVREQLDAVGDTLLLALPALEQVVIETVGAAGTGRREVRDVADRWLVRRAEGTVAAADVEELPAEQRRLTWSVVWALPRADDADVPRVLHAPTPTDVPLTFPAILLATFPVDPGRRRVLPSTATDRIAAAAGREYAALVGEVARDRGADALGLVPGGLHAGELDGAVREAALEALGTTPLLPRTDGEPTPTAPLDAADATPLPAPGDAEVRLVAPRDAVALAAPLGDDEAVARAVGTVVVPQRYASVLRRLGARVLPLADLLDELPGAMPPARWRDVYAALAPHISAPAVRDALAGAPVPLADGRIARGARGLVLPPAPSRDETSAAGILGVRIVHPEAAHPVLERVGAVPFAPRTLLADLTVRSTALAAASALMDDGDPGGHLVDPLAEADPEDVVTAVLHLAAAARDDAPAAALPFWLGELPVATTDGDLAPLRETALPGTWAEDALDALAVVDPGEVARFGSATLEAAGAHAALDVYTVRHAVTPADDTPAYDEEPDPADDPDDAATWLASWSEYLADLAGRWGPDVLVDELEAVADLDAVADDAWPDALRRLAADPATRRALLARPRPGPGARAGAQPAPSYTAWWLRRRLGAPFALHADLPLLPPAPSETDGLDEEVLRALGGVGSVEEPEPGDWADLLDALPPAGEPMPLRDALAVWRGLAAQAARLDPHARTTALPHLPDRLPALHADGTVEVTEADDLLVAGGARWAQLGPVVPAAPDLAGALGALLDLPAAASSPEISGGQGRVVDARVRALDPRIPERWLRHESLTVDGVAVSFWVDDDGVAHATGPGSLARALADLLGAPHLAPLLAAALENPEDAQVLWSTTAWAP